jgi:endonuclease/exonuclease/phosphatase family metal-dependent hydrolase
MAKPWRTLAESGDVDLGLLQEAMQPPSGLATEILPGEAPSGAPGKSNRSFRTVIARFTDRVRIEEIPTAAIRDAGHKTIAVSRPGTIALACVVPPGCAPIVVASVYGAWERAARGGVRGVIYSDASVHRVISDLSALLDTQRTHRVIVAGDLNVLHGYGEHGSAYWKARYETIFVRLEALGLAFAGPQHPHGEMASPRPAELPEESRDVPTFRTRRADPSSATRQLDFVFASRSLLPRLTVSARNSADECGPSDHCRVVIDVE